jgi:hypothetical protein
MGTFADTAYVAKRYRLPTEETKIPFSVSVCRKQTEVFHFPYAANITEVGIYVYDIIYVLELLNSNPRLPFIVLSTKKNKLPFSISVLQQTNGILPFPFSI